MNILLGIRKMGVWERRIEVMGIMGIMWIMRMGGRQVSERFMLVGMGMVGVVVRGSWKNGRRGGDG